MSRNPFHAGTVFVATLVRYCYGLSGCSPPCTDLTGLPATGGFYFQAFNGSVSLPVAGYDYNSDWTPLLAGLSPAGMAASLAALVRPCVARFQPAGGKRSCAQESLGMVPGAKVASGDKPASYRSMQGLGGALTATPITSPAIGGPVSLPT